jgi:hypothetical protein
MLNACPEPNTPATPSELRRIVIVAIMTIRNIEKKSLLGRLPGRLSLSCSHAESVAVQNQTDTITITIDRWKSNGSAGAVTFDSTLLRREVGASDFVPENRFHFSAKAQPDDHFGSKHPTIKPVTLIKWLADLHLPQGARMIDPFSGTGPIVFARPDLDMTLIEREDEYVADIKRRIAHVEGGGLLRSQEIARRKGGQDEPPPADGLFGWTGASAAE